MTLKRLAAFAVAVALVVGALFLRGALDDNSQGSTTSDEPTNSGTYRLICSTEFEAVCESIADTEVEVTIEPAGVTLDRLATAEDGELPDAWITLDPFPAMLDQTRDLTTSFGPATQRTDPIAVTDQSFVTSTTKAEALMSDCGTTSIAGCLAARAGESWSTLDAAAIPDKVKLGIADPRDEALGLVAFANGVAGYFDTIEFDPNDLRSGDANAWLRTFARNAVVFSGSTTPLATMLVRDTKVDVAVTSLAEVEAYPVAQADNYQVLTPEPAFQLHAVFAVLGGDDDVGSQVASALDAAGWEPSADHTPLPASTFINLRNLWESN